jgi:hypothetical protein
VEDTRQRDRCGVRGIVFARGTPAIQIVVVLVGVTVLLGLRNAPRSWTGTVGPSLHSFTTALVWIPCYAVGLFRWPKSVLQDSPKVYGMYMHLYIYI